MTRDSSESADHYAEDFLGSSRVMTTASGQVCYNADFLPYGQEVDYTETCSSHYGFEGKEHDSLTNNDDFGARYYRSAIYRWISPDWSATAEPVPYANLDNLRAGGAYVLSRASRVPPERSTTPLNRAPTMRRKEAENGPAELVRDPVQAIGDVIRSVTEGEDPIDH